MYYLTRSHIFYLASLNMSNQHPSRFPKESSAWGVGIFAWEAFPSHTHRVLLYPLVERLPFVLHNQPGIIWQEYAVILWGRGAQMWGRSPQQASAWMRKAFLVHFHHTPIPDFWSRCDVEMSQCGGMLNRSWGLSHPHTFLPQEVAQKVNKSLKKLYVKVSADFQTFWSLTFRILKFNFQKSAVTFCFFQNSPKEGLLYNHITSKRVLNSRQLETTWEIYQHLIFVWLFVFLEGILWLFILPFLSITYLH